MSYSLAPASASKNFVDTAYEGIKSLIQQHPESVAGLLQKHGYKVSPTRRNVGNAIKVDKSFLNTLIAHLQLMQRPAELPEAHQTTAISNFGGYSNLIGDQERFTLADRLANAGLVFANIIRDTQHKPENYQQRVPDYYEPTGKFNTRMVPESAIQSTRFLGMDKKLAWVLGGVLALFLVYELNKHK
jgi:hypothetical protein